MANKNTLRLRAAKRKEVKTKDSRVVSRNPKRNMQMAVYKNPGGSLTVHEPIDKNRPAFPVRNRYSRRAAQQETEE